MQDVDVVSVVFIVVVAVGLKPEIQQERSTTRAYKCYMDIDFEIKEETLLLNTILQLNESR